MYYMYILHCTCKLNIPVAVSANKETIGKDISMGAEWDANFSSVASEL